MNVNIVDTLALVGSIVAVGGIIIAYMRSISLSIERLSLKIDGKVDEPQCVKNMAACPCNVIVKGVEKTIGFLRKDIHELFTKSNNLDKRVTTIEASRK